MIFTGIIIGTSLIYTCIIFWVYSIWTKNTQLSITNPNRNEAGISVVIAARNEEQNIIKCIASIITETTYKSQYEVIIIDDHSDDKTSDLVLKANFSNVSLFSLPDNLMGKKAAITYGISKAKYPIIVLTDADCNVDKDWINIHAEKYNDPSVQMCTGIVLPDEQNSILSGFQFFDLAATMAVTNAGINTKIFFLANGANMSFRKQTFIDLDGYEGNDDMASGDDVFFAKKISTNYAESIRYIKDDRAIAYTKAETSWHQLINQRIRWASKSTRSNNFYLTLIQGFIFLYGAVFFIGMLTAIGLRSYSILTIIFSGITFKLLVDLFFLKYMSNYFSRRFNLFHFFGCFFIYFFHVLGSGILALTPTKYNWKGRMVR